MKHIRMARLAVVAVLVAAAGAVFALPARASCPDGGLPAGPAGSGVAVCTPVQAAGIALVDPSGDALPEPVVDAWACGEATWGCTSTGPTGADVRSGQGAGVGGDGTVSAHHDAYPCTYLLGQAENCTHAGHGAGASVRPSTNPVHAGGGNSVSVDLGAAVACAGVLSLFTCAGTPLSLGIHPGNVGLGVGGDGYVSVDRSDPLCASSPAGTVCLLSGSNGLTAGPAAVDAETYQLFLYAPGRAHACPYAVGTGFAGCIEVETLGQWYSGVPWADPAWGVGTGGGGGVVGTCLTNSGSALGHTEACGDVSGPDGGAGYVIGSQELYLQPTPQACFSVSHVPVVSYCRWVDADVWTYSDSATPLGHGARVTGSVCESDYNDNDYEYQCTDILR